MLEKGHHRRARRKSGKGTRRSGNVEMTVLEWALRVQTVVLHARGQDHERRRGLVSAGSLRRGLVVALS